MTSPADPNTDVTLDPADWDGFRQLAHRMVDDMLDYLRSLPEQPAWQPMPATVREQFERPIPREGLGDAQAYEQFVRNVLPYTNGNRHPRFFGWVQGPGTPLAMMADMLAAGLDAHLAGFDQAPAKVEAQVLRWLSELMGFPSSASGVLVLGGSQANVHGLAVARHVNAGFDVRELGLQGERPRLRVYASAQTHGWLSKAVELLGLGRASVRYVATDDRQRVRVDELRAAVQADRQAGLRPICVVGNAGTVNTGAIDDLDALADLCRDEQLWFHVDGAFGALARLSERLRGRVRGIERADSLAFDLHKWMYQPFDVACVLVREGQRLLDTFASTASYLTVFDRGVIAGGLPFADRGIDMSRSFRALKVWMSLEASGVDAFARQIEQDVEHARLLGERVEREPELDLLAPVELNIVCFRYCRGDDADLDAINREIMLRVQESGEAVFSSTTLAGKFALRLALVNHRRRRADLDRVLDAVLRHGRELTG